MPKYCTAFNKHLDCFFNMFSAALFFRTCPVPHYFEQWSPSVMQNFLYWANHNTKVAKAATRHLVLGKF